MKQDIFKNFKKEVRKYPINAVKVLEKMAKKYGKKDFLDCQKKKKM